MISAESARHGLIVNRILAAGDPRAELVRREQALAQLLDRLDRKIVKLLAARDERARGLANLRAAIDRSVGPGSYDHGRAV